MSFPVFHFRDDVTPRLHQSQPFPMSRGWLLSQSEPSHQNEAGFDNGADNTTVRVDGRIKRANLPFSTKHPVVLPRKNHVTDLLIYIPASGSVQCSILPVNFGLDGAVSSFIACRLVTSGYIQSETYQLET